MSNDRRNPLVAFLALVRLPNLFTAPPDIVLGAALATGASGPVLLGPLAGLAITSMLLYAAGTTLNDYFDAPVDAHERPDRPIPAGDISRRTALASGVALLIGGIAVALAAVGPVGGAVAAVLALVVTLYDGVFKGGPVGFVFMGGARGLNVLLGTTSSSSPLALPLSDLAVPLVVLLYIASVTYMAADETEGGNRDAVVVAIGGTVLAALAVLGRLAGERPGGVDAALALVLVGAFLAWTGRALRDAYADPVSETVGPAVGACVLGLVVLDGAFAATVGHTWALAAVAFVVPAVGLSRVFAVT